MNGNVYILLPFAKLRLTSGVLQEIGDAVSRNLNSYYKAMLRVSCVDEPDAQMIKVYIMDPHSCT